MSYGSYTIEQMLDMLEAAPRRIYELSAGSQALGNASLTPDQLQAVPDPGEWSANEVLAHLRSCSDVWGSYIEKIITQDKPAIRAVSPRSYIKDTDYCEQNFLPSLEVFTRQRFGLVATLRSLAPEGWSRAAIVTAVGRTYPRTVLDYVDRLVSHERDHIRQIESIADTMRR